MNEQRKLLYLVRHAKSSWDDNSLSDRERPLNARGERDAPEMGRRLAAQGHVPDAIISSPARRALATARHIARASGRDPDSVVQDEGLYLAAPGAMLKRIERVDDDCDSLMLVGHNPGMTHLLNHLADAGVANMVTGAVAVIAFDMVSWGEVQIVAGELVGYDYPKGPGRFEPGRAHHDS